MNRIIIENDGPRIRAANYWQTEWAQYGAFYLSLNAGAFRLLVPRAQEALLDEFRTGREVLISRGPWPAAQRADALEILFDDNTDDPFALHLGLEQIDRLPRATDAGREVIFSAWTFRGGEPRLSYQAPCFYRLVPRLPCLQPRGKA
jgi:hypothetical protein